MIICVCSCVSRSFSGKQSVTAAARSSTIKWRLRVNYAEPRRRNAINYAPSTRKTIFSRVVSRAPRSHPTPSTRAGRTITAIRLRRNGRETLFDGCADSSLSSFRAKFRSVPSVTLRAIDESGPRSAVTRGVSRCLNHFVVPAASSLFADENRIAVAPSRKRRSIRVQWNLSWTNTRQCGNQRCLNPFRGPAVRKLMI